MIPEILQENERQLRKDIERRQYDELPRRLEDIRRIACEHGRPEVALWLQGTIEWARLMVMTQRQAWADELDRLPMVNRYLERNPRALPAVCIDL
jgi:hypothetical protein